MKTFRRSLYGGVQRVLGNAPAGAPSSVPRWTAAELGLMSLAGVLLLVGVLVIATNGRTTGPLGSAPNANVTATKVGAPDPVAPGAPLDFTLTFHTDMTITVFSIDDPIPAQIDYVSTDISNLGTLNCGLVGSTLECRNGSLGADQIGSVKIHTLVHANAVGTIQNTASYVWAGGPQQQVSGSVNVVGPPSPTATVVPATDTPTPAVATDTPTAGAATDTPTAGLSTDTPTPGAATDTPTPGGPIDTPTETPTTGPATDTPTPGGPSDTPTPTGDETPTITPRPSPTVPATDTPVDTATPGSPVPSNTPVGPPSDTPVVPPSDTPVGPPPPTDTAGPSPTPFVFPSSTPTEPGGGGGGGRRTPVPTVVGGCGDITGTLTLHGAPAVGLTVELRSKANNGGDSVLATTTTDSTGAFHFRGIAASPADAMYYIRYPGGAAGTVAVWFAPGFSYTGCATQTVTSIDVTDVPFTGICNNGNLALPGAITWTPRNTTDRYRLFIYAGSVLALDTGDLGNTGSYTVAAGRLPDGNYTARLTIIDPNGGNGQSSSSCVFSVGVAAGGTPVPPPAPPPGFGTPAATATTGTSSTAVVPATIPAGATPVQGPDLRLSMTVDSAAAYPGETLDYTITVFNAGAQAAPNTISILSVGAQATNAILSDPLADGLLLDPSNTTASRGQVKPEGNTVRVLFGTIAPAERITVTVRASVIASPGSIVTNSATLMYDQVTTPVKSNVVETLIVGFGTPKPVKTNTPSAGVKGTVVPIPSVVTVGKTPVPSTGTQTNSTGSTTPRTGGEFPLFTGLTLVLLALLLRQVRLRRQATASNRS